MAHLAKYTLNSAQALFHHNLRHKDRKGEYVAYGGSKIDTTKTHLNYRLDPNTDPNEFITQRLSEIKVQKRADVKVYCSWVLTVPQNLPTEKHREFFESAYRFFCQDYGKENIVMASVHLDETTPHMHLGFVPVVRETKNQKKLGQEKVSAKELLTRSYMKNLHKRLKNVLERDLNCRVDITIDRDEDVPKREYVPLTKLKKQTEAEAKKLESLKKQSEELQGEIDSLKELQKGQEQKCRELTDRECGIRAENAKLESHRAELLQEIKDEAERAFAVLFNVLGIEAPDRERSVESRETLTDKNECLTRQNKALTEENSRLRSALSTERSKNSILLTRIAELARLEQAEKELRELKAKLKDFEFYKNVHDFLKSSLQDFNKFLVPMNQWLQKKRANERKQNNLER